MTTLTTLTALFSFLALMSLAGVVFGLAVRSALTLADRRFNLGQRLASRFGR